MVELVIGGIICFISTYSGIQLKNYYSKRLKYLKDIDIFVLEMIDNLQYASDNLYSACDRFIVNNKGNFADDLTIYAKAIKEKYLESNYSQYFSSKYLKKQDKYFINELFSTLGKLDYESQLSKLNYERNQLEKIIKKAQIDNDTTGKLMSKLGLLAGIALMIILA